MRPIRFPLCLLLLLLKSHSLFSEIDYVTRRGRSVFKRIPAIDTKDLSLDSLSLTQLNSLLSQSVHNEIPFSYNDIKGKIDKRLSQLDEETLSEMSFWELYTTLQLGSKNSSSFPKSLTSNLINNILSNCEATHNFLIDLYLPEQSHGEIDLDSAVSALLEMDQNLTPEQLACIRYLPLKIEEIRSRLDKVQIPRNPTQLINELRAASLVHHRYRYLDIPPTAYRSHLLQRALESLGERNPKYNHLPHYEIEDQDARVFAERQRLHFPVQNNEPFQHAWNEWKRANRVRRSSQSFKKYMEDPTNACQHALDEWVDQNTRPNKEQLKQTLAQIYEKKAFEIESLLSVPLGMGCLHTEEMIRNEVAAYNLTLNDSLQLQWSYSSLLVNPQPIEQRIESLINHPEFSLFLESLRQAFLDSHRSEIQASVDHCIETSRSLKSEITKMEQAAYESLAKEVDLPIKLLKENFEFLVVKDSEQTRLQLFPKSNSPLKHQAFLQWMNLGADISHGDGGHWIRFPKQDITLPVTTEELIGWYKAFQDKSPRSLRRTPEGSRYRAIRGNNSTADITYLIAPLTALGKFGFKESTKLAISQFGKKGLKNVGRGFAFGTAIKAARESANYLDGKPVDLSIQSIAGAGAAGAVALPLFSVMPPSFMAFFAANALRESVHEQSHGHYASMCERLGEAYIFLGSASPSKRSIPHPKPSTPRQSAKSTSLPAPSIRRSPSNQTDRTIIIVQGGGSNGSVPALSANPAARTQPKILVFRVPNTPLKSNTAPKAAPKRGDSSQPKTHSDAKLPTDTMKFPTPLYDTIPEWMSRPFKFPPDYDGVEDLRYYWDGSRWVYVTPFKETYSWDGTQWVLDPYVGPHYQFSPKLIWELEAGGFKFDRNFDDYLRQLHLFDSLKNREGGHTPRHELIRRSNGLKRPTKNEQDMRSLLPSANRRFNRSIFNGTQGERQYYYIPISEDARLEIELEVGRSTGNEGWSAALYISHRTLPSDRNWGHDVERIFAKGEMHLRLESTIGSPSTTLIIDKVFTDITDHNFDTLKTGPNGDTEVKLSRFITSMLLRALTEASETSLSDITQIEVHEVVNWETLISMKMKEIAWRNDNSDYPANSPLPEEVLSEHLSGTLFDRYTRKFAANLGAKLTKGQVTQGVYHPIIRYLANPNDGAVEAGSVPYVPAVKYSSGYGRDGVKRFRDNKEKFSRFRREQPGMDLNDESQIFGRFNIIYKVEGVERLVRIEDAPAPEPTLELLQPIR